MKGLFRPKEYSLRSVLSAIAVALLMAGCSDPRNTRLPDDISQMESIKPQIQKLNEEDRNFLTGYLMRRSIAGTIFGGIAGDIGSGPMTIGDAIKNQRDFLNEKEKKEAEEKQQKAKLKEEQDAMRSEILKAASVSLISKKTHTRHGAFSGLQMDKTLMIEVGYKNIGDKNIAMIKGELKVVDLLDDEVTSFIISNDQTIKAGSTSVWKGSRSIQFGLNRGADEKFAAMNEDKYKTIWIPKAIAFTDGTRLVVPE